MPEGPEVWILRKAISQYYNDIIVFCHGKHLYLEHDKYLEEYTFGLTGKVEINDETDKLTKKQIGFCYGDYSIISKEEEIFNKLGPSFMEMDHIDCSKLVETWRSSRKLLGALLLDQKIISGIGVAWGSELLHKANLVPDKKACEQNLDNLVLAFLEIQEYCKNIYSKYLSQQILNSSCDDVKRVLKTFINGWYKNLYKVREMSVYKKGKQCKTGGRTWWI
jgi:formamidopyrimidine-DNA glycosylase